MNTQGFMLEYAMENMDGRAMGLIIASRNIIIDWYITAAKTNLIQKYQDRIKLAVLIPSLLTKYGQLR